MKSLSRLTPRDPMDCSLPGSSIHGIFQVRVLEWGAIAFSGNACLLCAKRGPKCSTNVTLKEKGLKCNPDGHTPKSSRFSPYSLCLPHMQANSLKWQWVFRQELTKGKAGSQGKTPVPPRRAKRSLTAFLRPPKVPRHAGFPRGEHRGSRHRFL